MDKLMPNKRISFSENSYIIISLCILVCFFSLATKNFFSLSTLTTILNQLPALTLVTIGMTLVLISGGIDLSVGSILALSAGVIGIVNTRYGMSLPIAALAGIGVGACAGLLNGFLGGYCRLPIFIVTLGMLEAARGMAYLSTGSQTIYLGAGVQQLALPWLFDVLSIALIISLAMVVMGHWVLTRTVFGRYLIAIGTNPKAAQISGVDARPYVVTVLVISGALAGLGGLMNTAYLGAVDPNAGIGLELSAIAAAVIGGTSLMGGRGSILGAFIGVLIIAVLQNGLAQMGISEPVKRLVTGGVIVLAVVLDRWRNT
jgi:ribose transport system permease protein